jgi:hypothetical protein
MNKVCASAIKKSLYPALSSTTKGKHELCGLDLPFHPRKYVKNIL